MMLKLILFLAIICFSRAGEHESMTIIAEHMKEFDMHKIMVNLANDPSFTSVASEG